MIGLRAWRRYGAGLLLAAVLATSAAGAEKKRETFDQWMGRVYATAPRYRLVLHPHDPFLREGEEEFFYLYCWQSQDHSVVGAIKFAKKVWGINR